jgi:hypothetical protein
MYCQVQANVHLFFILAKKLPYKEIKLPYMEINLPYMVS